MLFRTSAAMFSAFACVSAASVAACGSEAEKPLTQLVLVADTNVPDVKQVEFDFRADGKEPPAANKRRANVVAGTPLYFSLVYDGGSIDAPITVSASGLNAKGELVVRRKAIVKYVRDQTRTVPLHLLKSCEDLREGEPQWKYCEKKSQTCTEKGCAALELNELDSWDGERIPMIPGSGQEDGGASGSGGNGGSSTGMSGSGGTSAGTNTGGTTGGTNTGGTNTGGTNTGGTNTGGTNTGGTNTGGTTGGTMGGVMNCQGVDTNTSIDVNNCGTCGKVCSVAANQEPLCENGSCKVTCVSGYQDCKPGAGVSAGCETVRVDTSSTCGPSCVKCPNTQSCVGGTCQ